MEARATALKVFVPCVGDLTLTRGTTAFSATLTEGGFRLRQIC